MVDIKWRGALNGFASESKFHASHLQRLTVSISKCCDYVGAVNEQISRYLKVEGDVAYCWISEKHAVDEGMVARR